MIPLNYTYFFVVIIGFLFWTLVFVKRKDFRFAMFLFSFCSGVSGYIFSGSWFVSDWWHPSTITGTSVGIEDFILGFTLTGIIMFIYPFLFRKKIIQNNPLSLKNNMIRSSVLIFYFVAVYLLFFTLSVPTFNSVYIASIASSIVIFLIRKDLFLPGFVTGILMVLFTMPIYWIVMIVSPDWINATYDFISLSGIMFLGIPIEELLFFFFWSIFMGVLYEFWFDKKFD